MTSSSPAYPRARHLLGWPFAAGLAGIVAAEMFGSSMADGAWRSVAIPAWYAAWGGWAVWLCRRKGIGLRRLVGRWPGERAAWRYVGMALPLLLLSTGLFLLQVAVAARMAPERVHDWLAEDPTAPAASTASSALELLAVLALAPVVEELVFRGVLLPGWSRRRGRRTAVLGTAALFAMLHPTDLLGSLVFGVVLAAIRLRTRTLLVPIACHALFNALV
ncbi:MAG TPA: CPBP family intramembrane glutamic endopeptidase, partial [Longimicrobiaceae bacterium]